MAEKEIKLAEPIKNRPEFRSGDTLRVWQRITDRVMEKDKVKEKKRLQAFEGMVLARKHGEEAGATFTVRRVVDGVGVERIFPFHSPTIEKIEVLRQSKTRRAKLYNIRDKAAKEIKREMRAVRMEREPAKEIAEVTEESKVEEVKKEEIK